MNEQSDIAVDLGVVPLPLPEILSLRQLVETAPPPPGQIIERVLHQGVQDDPGGHQQKQQELVFARPGDQRGQRRW